MSVQEWNGRTRSLFEDELARLRTENAELTGEIKRLSIVCEQMGQGLRKHREWAKAARKRYDTNVWALKNGQDRVV